MKIYAPVLMLLAISGCDRSTTPGTASTTGANLPVRNDNTKVNERDMHDTLTPFDQGNDPGDIATTRLIRQALVGDDSLSTDGKNIKVITNDGMVTLRGPVSSAAEREAIGAKAAEIAGPTRVNNQLDVANTQ